MRPDVVSKAIDSVLQQSAKVLIMEPWGEPFTQLLASEFSKEKQLILVCGHYEGIDARVQQKYDARAISVGDYVLTGGELPALIIADAVTRLLEGVLGDPESLQTDSHANGLLSYPQYTRPWEWEGLTPPDVLRSGNHAEIAKWRRQTSLRMTQKLRPDLFAKVELERSDFDLL